MPLLLKDYTWRQTDVLVIIHVPLKGVCHKNLDLFTSDKYLKLHSPPHLFEIFLWKPIVEADSSCTLTDGEAILQLVKQTPELWPSVTADISRQEALELKRKAIEEAQTKSENRRKETALIKDQRQKAAVREQIRLNTEEREIIEKSREKEKTDALVQMGWPPHPTVKILELPVPEKENKMIHQKNKGDKEIFKNKKAESSSNNFIPGPRQASQITVSFTPRIFPTPCRESKMAEEQEWLSKQAEARRRSGFVVEDLRPEELDPVWLCEKAKSFYDVGNYLGAVSAYTHALSLNNHMHEIYAGRAEAQLKLGNFNRAVIDSSKALELLTPPVPANLDARANCMLCRGSALAALGLTNEALGELKAAKTLKPDSSDIQQALSKIENEQFE